MEKESIKTEIENLKSIIEQLSLSTLEYIQYVTCTHTVCDIQYVTYCTCDLTDLGKNLTELRKMIIVNQYRIYN